MRWNALDNIAYWLVIIGGINWGLVGFFNFNLVDSIFGSTFARVIYSLVGLSALYLIYAYRKINRSEHTRV